MALDTSIVAIKVIEQLRADAEILSYVSSALAIRVAPLNPQSRFPCITIDDDPDESETEIPATHGNLMIVSWVDVEKLATDEDPVEKLWKMSRRILTLLDFKSGAPVTAIPTIRVPEFRRVSGPSIDYIDEIGKFQASIIFRYTVSYNETFLDADAGNKPWV